jgi:hypothetical protein
MKPTIEELLESAKKDLIKYAQEFNALAMEVMIEEPPNPNKMQGLQQLAMLFGNSYSQLNALKATYATYILPTSEPEEQPPA